MHGWSVLAVRFVERRIVRGIGAVGGHRIRLTARIFFRSLSNSKVARVAGKAAP
jgi:hypothetical protein